MAKDYKKPVSGIEKIRLMKEAMKNVGVGTNPSERDDIKENKGGEDGEKNSVVPITEDNDSNKPSEDKKIVVSNKGEEKPKKSRGSKKNESKADSLSSDIEEFLYKDLQRDERFSGKDNPFRVWSHNYERLNLVSRAYDVSITKLVNNIIDEAFESNPELLESAKTRLLEKTKTELGLA